MGRQREGRCRVGLVVDVCCGGVERRIIGVGGEGLGVRARFVEGFHFGGVGLGGHFCGKMGGDLGEDGVEGIGSLTYL